jgi:shikimate kinase
MGKNLVLIGFMGTGKSSVGVRLAKRLKREFVDMDRAIEIVCDMSVADIFKRYGEKRFRSEESLMAAKLGKQQDLIISTGGGVVLFPDNMAALKENGLLICLDSNPADILARVSRKKGTRPLLKKNISVAEIERLLKEREAFYAQADARVNTSGKDMEKIIREIVQIMQENNFEFN